MQSNRKKFSYCMVAREATEYTHEKKEEWCPEPKDGGSSSKQVVGAQLRPPFSPITSRQLRLRDIF